MKNIFQKIKIAFIHFIRKPIFILRFRYGLIHYSKKFKPFYFLGNNKFDTDDFAKSLSEIQQTDNIIIEADLILQNKFQTLGSDLINLGEKINWHKDFKSGRIWEKDFYNKIDPKHSINGSDIKVPWELSRFHQAQWLAKAYLLSKDEKYSKKFFELVNNWIEENHFCYGVNWNCAMEVAIRAVNWILALHIFRFSKHFSLEAEKNIYRSLFQHGIFIRNNLEYGRRNGNHYLSDLMGLMWLGAFFFEHSFGKRWFRFAQKELEKEIQIQVYNDGVDYEKSTYYQRLVTEILMLSYLAAEKIKKSFSTKFANKLHRMFNFIASYIIDDEVPNVGDCDDGRVIKFNFFENISEMKNLLSIGAVLFEDSSLKSKASRAFCDLLFLLGTDGYQRFKELNRTEIKQVSVAFSDGGFYVLRNADYFIFFDAGDIGMNGWGGHGHNDTFSFELAYHSKRFIVDSGTYVYTPNVEIRQKLRSTSSHNTVMVDKTEQVEFLNLFRIKADLTRPKILLIQLNDSEKDFVEAEHYGYTRLKNSVIVKRKIELDKVKNQVLIEDKFLGNGSNLIEIYFHFHPEVVVNKIATSIYELHRNDLKLKIEFAQNSQFNEKLEDYIYSESYGRLAKNQRLRITIENKIEQQNPFITLIKAVR
jgi:uncharacterized heparinase superfamily protein